MVRLVEGSFGLGACGAKKPGRKLEATCNFAKLDFALLSFRKNFSPDDG
jgi:hypothetical protein